MIRVLSYSLLVTLCLLGSTAVRALDAADLPAAVENAKTAADHEAIAAYYEAQAKAARAEAERHRSMGAIYKKSRSYAGKGTSPTLNTTMPPHCDELATSYGAAAKAYDAMAAAQREAASDVQ